MTFIGIIWSFAGTMFIIWFLGEVLGFIKDFIIVLKNYIKE